MISGFGKGVSAAAIIMNANLQVLISIQRPDYITLCASYNGYTNRTYTCAFVLSPFRSTGRRGLVDQHESRTMNARLERKHCKLGCVRGRAWSCRWRVKPPPPTLLVALFVGIGQRTRPF